jgi:hypothetical protein
MIADISEFSDSYETTANPDHIFRRQYLQSLCGQPVAAVFSP